MARVMDTRRSRFLLAALVLTHLVVISRQVEGVGGASLLEEGIFGILSPVQRALGSVVAALRSTWGGYVGLRHAKEENTRLKERLRLVETALQQQAEKAQEAERLRELMELRPLLPFETVVAEVIARDGVPWFRSLTLNKGYQDGVTLNAAVISPYGVVGRVVAVGPAACKVQVILDRDSGVGARLERTRLVGVASGQVGFEDAGSSDLELKYVPALADVKIGDLVVTSGLDRIYPEGLLVGRVKSVVQGAGLFKDIKVQPSARFEKLEELMVVKRAPEDTLTTERVR